MSKDPNVYVNGRPIIYKDSGAQVVTPDDVCWTPNGSGSDTPVTYTSVATSADAEGCAERSLVDGKPVCTTASIFSRSTGAEAGVNGGVKSGTVSDRAEFLTGSPDVFIGGQAVARHGDLMTNNAGNTAPAEVMQPGGRPLDVNVEALAAEAVEREALPDRYVAGLLGAAPMSRTTAALRDGVVCLEQAPEEDSLSAWHRALDHGFGAPVTMGDFEGSDHRASLTPAAAESARAFLQLPGDDGSVYLPLGPLRSEAKADAEARAREAEDLDLALRVTVPTMRDGRTGECLPPPEGRRLYIFMDGHLWRELEIDHRGCWRDIDLARHAGRDQRPAGNIGQPWVVLPARIDGREPKLEMALSAVPWSWQRIQTMGGLADDDWRRLALKESLHAVEDAPGGRDRAWRCQRCETGALAAGESAQANGDTLGLLPAADLPPVEDPDLLGDREADAAGTGEDPLEALRRSGVTALIINDPLYQAETRQVAVLRARQWRVGLDQALGRGEYGLAIMIDVARQNPELAEHVDQAVLDQKIREWGEAEDRIRGEMEGSERAMVETLESDGFQRALSDFMDEPSPERRAGGVAWYAALIVDLGESETARAHFARLAKGELPLLEMVPDPDERVADVLGRMETQSFWDENLSEPVRHAVGLGKGSARRRLSGPVARLAEAMSSYWLDHDDHGLEALVAFAHRFADTGARVTRVHSHNLIREQARATGGARGVLLHPAQAANAPSFEIDRIRHGFDPRPGRSSRKARRLIRLYYTFEVANALFAARYLAKEGIGRDWATAAHLGAILAASMIPVRAMLESREKALRGQARRARRQGGYARAVERRTPNSATRRHAAGLAGQFEERASRLRSNADRLDVWAGRARLLGTAGASLGTVLDYRSLRRDLREGNSAGAQASATMLTGNLLLAAAVMLGAKSPPGMVIMGASLSLGGGLGHIMSRHSELERLLRHGRFGRAPYASDRDGDPAKPESDLEAFDDVGARDLLWRCSPRDFEAELNALHQHLSGGQIVIRRRRELLDNGEQSAQYGYFDVSYVPGLFQPGRSRIQAHVDIYMRGSRRRFGWVPGVTPDHIEEMRKERSLTRDLVARPCYGGREESGPLESLRMLVRAERVDLEQAEVKAWAMIYPNGDESVSVAVEAVCEGAEIEGEVRRSDFDHWARDWRALLREGGD